LLALQRVYALDGSISACNPGTDADAPEPGIFGAGNLPGLMRRDFVQNSNDSYWLANPAARLEGYSQIIGADENRPQGLRTRLGITQIRDRQAGSDGLPGAGFSRQWLQDVLYANRHHSAEIMLDGVLQLCATQDPNVVIGGQVQFDVRNGRRLPIHGGSGTSGVYNAITPSSLVANTGYTPVLGGTSYVQAVTFTSKGPEARALVTYSQSSDPANPHYADMTALFSNYGWVDLPFAEGDIRRDPNLRVMQLHEKR
jgi:acyl-homoserine lactone acylase PvdQ